MPTTHNKNNFADANIETDANIQAEIFDLLQKLIAVESLTPHGDECLEMIENYLSKIGFYCKYLPFSSCEEFKDFPKKLLSPVNNLIAIYDHSVNTDNNGDYFNPKTISKPSLAFCGHVDVVPALDDWETKPFELTLSNGQAIARGVADMKGAIAAQLVAAKYISKKLKQGRITLLFTCDEEGPGLFGMRQVTKWLQERNYHFDHMIVGEPTCPKQFGEMVKIGRRGSLNGEVKIIGKQGHVAYPQNALNPIPLISEIANKLCTYKVDDGNASFLASNLEVTSIDINNKTTNIIPQTGVIKFNCRFNNLWRGDKLKETIHKLIDDCRLSYHKDLMVKIFLFVAGESFLTKGNKYQNMLCKIISDKTGITPQLSTSGGTSDARFLAQISPICEFGLTNATIHHKNETCLLKDIFTLSEIYYLYYKKLFELSS